MIDEDGYRPNVGIILCNDARLVFWAHRRRQDGWQFPQGGLRPQESPEAAMFRELREEVGLEPAHVEVLGRTRDWLRYEIPPAYRRRTPPSPIRGQKQIWFLLRFVGEESDVRLDASENPEFDAWRWIEYWRALDEIVEFKREVYRQALTELAPLLPGSPQA
jgi:putative (di)nucleoside polyphosphate hydrolase